MGTRKVLVTGRFALEVTIADDAPADVLTRASQPGFAYWQHSGEPLTLAQTVAHLTHNAVANGVQDLSQLDGWADLDRGAATMSVNDIEVDNWLAEG